MTGSRKKTYFTFALLAFAVTTLTAIAPPAAAQAGKVEKVGSLNTEAGLIAIENVVGGLEHPWGMAFLPDGRFLVTEEPGTLNVYDPESGELSVVAGTPKVYSEGQGGLLDVAVDPEFKNNRFIYLSYAKAGPDGSATTALGRGKLVHGQLEGFEVIFLEQPWITGPNHFGGRIEFSPEGKIFLTLGERFQFEPAQDLSSHLGTIVRINRDGSVPKSNPFVGKPDAQPEIWSYGHRNIEAAAIHPETGRLWVAEMGPLGGDELNQIAPGNNYGWPVVSWGENYDGTRIPDPPTHPRFAEPVAYWTPVIAPSGMMFYTGDVFEAWRGSAFIGGLITHGLVRVQIENGKVTEQTRLPLKTRIRDVVQGPDGLIYVLTDEKNGNVWRLKPLEGPKQRSAKRRVIDAFAHPESVARDAQSGLYYVSNIGAALKPTAKDDDGFISQLAPSGEIRKLHFLPAEGASTLHAPKGVAVIDGTLYVADIDRIVGFELASRKQVFEAPIPEKFSEARSPFLNDVTARGDNALFVSASNLGKVFSVSLKSGRYTPVASGIPAVNGLAFDAASSILYAVSFGQKGQPGGLYRIDLARDGNAAEVETLHADIGQLDGLVILPDDGRLLMSDWGDAKWPATFHLYNLQTDTLSEMNAAKGVQGPADFVYSAQANELWIPDLPEGQLQIVHYESDRQK